MAMDFIKKFGKKDGTQKSDSSAKPQAVVPTVVQEGARGDAKSTVQAERVLRRLVMTSKAGKVGEYEKYVFEVAPLANKIEIKKAFALLYGAMPLHVRTATQKARKVRFGRIEGKRKQWKKATVTVDAKKSVTIV